MGERYHHVSVLSRELVEGLALQEGGLYLDATVGGGGHSELVLAFPQTRAIAIDRDGQALIAAQARLQERYGDRIQFWQGNFADYEPGELKFHGIFADLGVSSAQLDQPERGFSFRHEAALDMRMDRTYPRTAADLVNRSKEKELADIFYYYGEERHSRRIAKHIVNCRPFETTTQLANAIAAVLPRHQTGRTRGTPIHPATRVFQALRIAVNEELTSIETFLAKAPLWLHPGGRLAIISFHSLEDRIVKHTLRATESLKVLTRKPIQAQPDELRENPRSRSAKLRIAEHL
ncbi:16S rRNA (cytosine(1402)-N(4))-methyltransferase RsmH [Altericista sp. CCNU0014]|uniref:16S rRNA (cytosine(1402)-N(4))-methyltransferase RsmH n=1 Tax=Altericista sp. CCNU0014 TaxID=3082949 RepID=UPI00384C198F